MLSHPDSIQTPHHATPRHTTPLESSWSRLELSPNPKVSVLEMDGKFDNLQELIYVESHLSNTATKFYGELTQQMLKVRSVGESTLPTVVGSLLSLLRALHKGNFGAIPKRHVAHSHTPSQRHVAHSHTPSQLSDAPGSDNGTGFFQTLCALKIREIYEKITSKKVAADPISVS